MVDCSHVESGNIISYIFLTSLTLMFPAIMWAESVSGASPGTQRKPYASYIKALAWVISIPWLLVLLVIFSIIGVFTLIFNGAEHIYEHSPAPIQKILKSLGVVALSPALSTPYLLIIFLSPLGILIAIFMVFYSS